MRDLIAIYRTTAADDQRAATEQTEHLIERAEALLTHRSLENMRMRSLSLTQAQQRRIAKLAELAGRTPEAMLRFVLRDGLEATEQDVREAIEADKDIDQNGAIPHEEVMTRARAAVERHVAKRQRKTA